MRPSGGRFQSAGKLLGHPVWAFASAAEFLAAYDREQPGCLVLDVRMPGMTGLELQRRLADDGVNIPAVMISGHADVRIAVEAMMLGAVTLLEKPFRLDELLAHVRRALEKDRSTARAPADGRRRRRPARRAHRKGAASARPDRGRQDEPRDSGCAAGGASVRAVEDRRARLMRKVNAGSVAELVRLLTIGS